MNYRNYCDPEVAINTAAPVEFHGVTYQAPPGTIYSADKNCPTPRCRRKRVRELGLCKHCAEGKRCCVDGCEGAICGQGPYCAMHWQRVYNNYGRPLESPVRRKGAPEGSISNDNGEGYVLIKRAGNWVRRNRAVMEAHLGRPLRPNEEVHHRNGVRSDDRIENLELWAKTHPAGRRLSDMLYSAAIEYTDELIEAHGEFLIRAMQEKGLVSR